MTMSEYEAALRRRSASLIAAASGYVAHARRQRRPAVPRSSKQTHEPTLYFLSSDYNKPSGGIRVMYRHVDVLNELGMRASILHEHPGFRCSWFENTTVVSDSKTTKIEPLDILVVPEIDVDLVLEMKGLRHIVLNQAAHLSWPRLPAETSEHYNESPDLLGVVTVSRYNRDYLTYAFPKLNVRRVRTCIDPTVFYGGGPHRSNELSYMPRRGKADADQLLAIMASRDALRNWNVVALDGLDQRSVAECLRRSKIFVTFPYQEGFGLPAAEAMACGNYVIGYHGYGGQEFFGSEFSAPIPTGDIVALARAVEDAIDSEEAESGWCARRGSMASDSVLTEYSAANERTDVEVAYSQMKALPR